MTELEFINLHQAGIINYPGRINANIFDNGDNTGTLTGVTVSVDAISVDGITTLPTVDIDNILNQVETIRFTYYGQLYELQVLEKTKYTPPSGTPYYYYKIESNLIIPDLTAASIFSGGVYDDSQAQLNTIISFTPFINDLVFAVSDFNIVYNNALLSRQSNTRVQADRSNRFEKPSNFDSILSGSATYAYIQDSLYSNIGFINSRYNGSKSTKRNYGGVSPSIAVKSFRGEIYTADANVNLACGTLESDRILVQLAHTGEQKLPTFSSSSLGVNTSTLINSADTNIIQHSGILSQSLDGGDIIQIEDSVIEKMRVINYSSFTKTIIVQRGYLGSPANTSITLGTPIDKLDRNDILQFGDNSSKVTAVNDAIIYVKDDNSLIYTDNFGTVYSSSACPIPTF